MTLLRNALPGSGQAETKAKANVAFDFFVETYGVKWDKAVAKLVKDRDALLTFYDYPAEHWKHIRTSNPIESTFATLRHRTKRTKGCLSRKTGLAMAFKLMILLGTLLRNTLTGNGRRRRNGARSTAKTACLRSSKGLSFAMGSANFKMPPDQGITNFCPYLSTPPSCAKPVQVLSSPFNASAKLNPKSFRNSDRLGSLLASARRDAKDIAVSSDCRHTVCGITISSSSACSHMLSLNVAKK